VTDDRSRAQRALDDIRGTPVAHIAPDDRTRWQKVKPTRKVAGATVGAAVGVILNWVVTNYTTVVAPPEVWAATDVLLVFAGGWLPKDHA
jgi:hypothetical protein